MSPYKALYGKKAPYTNELHLMLRKIQWSGQQWQGILTSLKETFHQAQKHMKQVDQHKIERRFQEGDMIFLRLHPYKQAPLKAKAGTEIQWTIKVLKRIGQVSYHLELPTSLRIHPIFHVNCLKQVLGKNIPTQTKLSWHDEEGKIVMKPNAILEECGRELTK